MDGFMVVGKLDKRDEQAFWARLAKSGPEAAEAVRKLSATTDPAEKMRLTDAFNQGRNLDGPYEKDGIRLDDGSMVKVYRDLKGNIKVGWSSS